MPNTTEPFKVYRSIVQQIMLDPAQLPSLPDFTFELRRVLQDELSSNDAIAKVCMKDPGFAALLIKTASSPIYRQVIPSSKISTIVGVLGQPKVASLAMIYSIKSLFVMRSPQLKALYQKIWERSVLKSSISAYLAKRITHLSVEEIMLAGLLSELGTLAILSVLKDQTEFPSNREFYKLCREYSKGFAAVLLKKWKLDDALIDIIKYCGKWNAVAATGFSNLDIVNLGLYCTVQIVNPENNLPPLSDIPSYKKLDTHFTALDENGNLALVTENIDEIKSIQKILL